LVLLESSAASSAEFQPVPFDTHHVEKVVEQGLIVVVKEEYFLLDQFLRMIWPSAFTIVGRKGRYST
jgi:hypothetical protein